MPFNKLIQGYKAFHKEHFGPGKKLFDTLVRDGQNPEVLMIGCSDSRADPAIITHAAPGDIFVVRNVSAIVPAYSRDLGHHGTCSAIEFAVRGLKVKQIVVMGHSMCGGVRALAERDLVAEHFEFLPQWVDIARSALVTTKKATEKLPEEERARELEKAVVLVSYHNLHTFPWIEERLMSGELTIHAWYFDMAKGKLLEYNPLTTRFEDLDGSKGIKKRGK